MSLKRHLKELKVYRPLPKFPPISVTGKGCFLNCKHCGRKYLLGMLHASQSNLYEIVKNLVEKEEINGILISGGLDSELKIPLPWEIIKKIKRDFELKVNVHVGFIDKKDIEKLVEAEVDVVSLDFVSDNKVIEEIYGIKKNVNDYIEIMMGLEDENVPYAPHVTIGLDWGKIHWEFNAIKYLSKRKAKVTVFNILIPTKGTMMEKVKPPSNREIRELFIYARKMLSDKELSLGCMRPRNVGYEILAIESEFDRMVLPRNETLEKARKMYNKITFHDLCCVI